MGALDNFLTAVVFQILFPLVPIGVEQWQRGSINGATLSLVGAMYAITVGVSSTSKFLFSCGIVIGVVFSVVYGGMLAQNPIGFAYSGPAALSCIFFVGIYHCIERYYLHVMLRKPFSILNSASS